MENAKWPSDPSASANFAFSIFHFSFFISDGLWAGLSVTSTTTGTVTKLSPPLPRNHKGRAPSDTPSLVLFPFALRDLGILQQPRRQEMLDRLLLFLQGAAQLHQRDVLQLPDAFTRDAEFLADFLERLRFAAIESEPREDDLLFAIVQDTEQFADFVAEILVAHPLDERQRFHVADDF